MLLAPVGTTRTPELKEHTTFIKLKLLVSKSYVSDVNIVFIDTHLSSAVSQDVSKERVSSGQLSVKSTTLGRLRNRPKPQLQRALARSTYVHVSVHVVFGML